MSEENKPVSWGMTESTVRIKIEPGGPRLLVDMAVEFVDDAALDLFHRRVLKLLRWEEKRINQLASHAVNDELHWMMEQQDQQHVKVTKVEPA